MYYNFKVDNNDFRMVVAYSRVSTKEQLEGYSIYNQDMTAKKIANTLGFSLDKIYKDEGISAYKEVKRPGFEDLIHDVEKNQIKIVIVWKSDRLIRNFVKSENIYQLFIKHKVTLISATQLWDFTTADGRKDVRKRSIDDQYESERTSERVKEVAHASASLGNYPKGHVPLGYCRIHNDYKTAPLMIDKNEGEKVRKIFTTMYNNKWGIKKLLDWLNGQRYMDKNWMETALYHILSNPIYIGIYVDNIVKPTYQIKNHTPALITDKIFVGVNELIHSRNYDKRYRYIYKGYVYCSTCGNKMIPSSTVKENKVYLYYYCKSCKKRINENKLSLLIAPLFDAEIYDIYKQNNILAKKQKELSCLDVIIQQLDESYIKEIITKDYYINHKERYLKDRYTIIKFIEKCTRNEKIGFLTMDFRSKLSWVHKNIDRINYNFTNATPSIQLKKKIK